MKLSEFKETGIAIRGKEEWEKIENTEEFKIYMAPEEEQLKMVKNSGYNIDYVYNQTEKMQADAIYQDAINIDYMKNPSANIISSALRSNRSTKAIVMSVLKYIENDLEEKEETIKLSELSKMSWEEIDKLIMKYKEETRISKNQDFYIDPIDPLSAFRYSKNPFL